MNSPAIPDIVMRLFVAGLSPQSSRAHKVIATLLDDPAFATRIKLDVIDVLQDPRQALREGLVTTPTVVLDLGERTLRFIGDFNCPDQLGDFLRMALL